MLDCRGLQDCAVHQSEWMKAIPLNNCTACSPESYVGTIPVEPLAGPDSLMMFFIKDVVDIEGCRPVLVEAILCK